VADLDGSAAEAIAVEASEMGVATAAVTADVTDERQAIAMVTEAAENLGGLDIVVNIVGMAAWKTLFELDVESWELDLSRNLTQHLFVCRAAAHVMIDQGTGGSMAVVSSVSGLYGAPNHAAYGAAKAGLMDLVRTMSQEWAGYNIRVNAVAPDCIATPRVKATYDAQGIDMDQQASDQGMPMARFGQPEEIAGPLVYLVSSLSTFVTGQSLVVDGGTQAAFPHVKVTTKF
jgi:NAD(P)-dependent dehydrogenase (short-subunit alcohol dehydrogenase family)